MRGATAAALLAYVMLSFLLTHPLPLHLADAVEDRQDALLNVWITAWDGHQLLNDPLHLFNANIFYPYRRTLAYSELLLGNGLLALPLTAASGNPILGYNLVVLLSFALSGFGTYLLVLALTGRHGAGFVAGTIFAFCAYRMSNLAQAQLLATQWLPFATLAFILLMRQSRRRGSAVFAFVLFFCLQALTSFYYGLLLSLAILGLFAWECLFGALPLPAHPGMREAAIRPRKGSLGYALLAAGCSALVIAPFALPYLQVQRELGFKRTLADSEPFSASLRQYLMVPPGSVVHGRWLPSDATPRAGGYPADALFPGIAALGLGSWGAIRGQGRTRWFFLALLLVAVCLSLGPRLHLAPGQPASLQIRLPYAWLYALVPGFKALRAPVRFDALVMLTLAVLAGYGVASLHGITLPSILAGVVVLESLVWPAARVESVPVAGRVAAVYDWMAGQTGAVLELPMAFAPGGPQLDYQYLSTYHWRPTPDGYSGFVPPKHGQIVYEMERFPSERSLSLLQALGVRHVVIHTGRYPAARRSAMETALAQANDLVAVDRFGSDQVYEVRPRSFDPAILEKRLYLPSPAARGQPYAAYVIAVNQSPRSYAVPPTEQLSASATWEGPDGTVSTDVTAEMPLVTSPDGGTAVIWVPLTAPASPGIYRLSIAVPGGPLGMWGSWGTVEVGDRAENAFPVPAQLAAWDIPSEGDPGGLLRVGLSWRALGKIDAYYSIYVKLLDGGGTTLAGWDGQPQDGQAPTLVWVPGDWVEDIVTLVIPEDILPGDYVLEVGMYRASDLARCLTLNVEGKPVDRIELGRVRIGP